MIKRTQCCPKKSPPALTWQQQLKWLIHWTWIFNGQSPNLFVSYLLQQIVSIRMLQHRKRNQLKLRLQQHQQHQPGFISQVSADHQEQPHSLTHWLVVIDSLESWDFLKSKFSKTIKKRAPHFFALRAGSSWWFHLRRSLGEDCGSSGSFRRTGPPSPEQPAHAQALPKNTTLCFVIVFVTTLLGRIRPISPSENTSKAPFYNFIFISYLWFVIVFAFNTKT